METLKSEPRSARRPVEMNTSCKVFERSSSDAFSETETGSEFSDMKSLTARSKCVVLSSPTAIPFTTALPPSLLTFMMYSIDDSECA